MSESVRGADGRERAAESAAALVALALYVVVVSRGELLPYAGAGRALTAPALTLALAGLLGWRLRRLPRTPAALALGRRLLLPGAVGLLAIGARALAAALVGAARPEEEAVLALALRIIDNRSPGVVDTWTAALGWLHAPVAGARFLAGVSEGRWQEIEVMTPADLLTWSRVLHGLLSLATVGLAGWVGARLGGRPAGLLAAGLLAVSGTSVASGAAVDWRAPLGLVAAAAMAAGASLVGRRWAGRFMPARTVAGAAVIAGMVGLWLPGPAGAVLAPVAAVMVAVIMSRGLGAARASGAVEQEQV